jgi:hypothetical protein
MGADFFDTHAGRGNRKTLSHFKVCGGTLLHISAANHLKRCQRMDDRYSGMGQQIIGT